MFRLIFEFPRPICKCNEVDHLKWSKCEWGTNKNGKNELKLGVKCEKCNVEVIIINSPAFITKGWTDSPIHQFENNPLTDDERKKLDSLLDEAQGKIVKVYPDEFYWINLSSSFSRYESYMMNHCGKDNRGELWSLRNTNKIPFVTLVIKDKEIIQIRGRSNNPPSEKYIAYVNDLIKNDILKEMSPEILKFITPNK